MNWADRFEWVFRSLSSYRLRSLLTILGFAVGIASVTLLSALGEGMRQFIMNEFTQFGSRIIAITPGKTETFGFGGLLNTTRPLTLDDAIQLKSLRAVEHVVPVVFGTGQIESVNRSRYTDIAAVGPQAAKAWKIDVAQGRFLPDDNIQQPRAYAVLGSELKKELFGNKGALGEIVRIAQTRFRVIGVMESKGEFLGTNLDDLIYIPAQKGLQLFNRNSLMEIDVFYYENISSHDIAELVKRKLIERHGMEDFTLITQDAMLDSMDDILQIVKVAAAGLGSIALLVGGVGILTIFSITVTERKQEIGLLRALGFTSIQLRNLFLYEAIALAIFGGLLGYSLILLPSVVAHYLFPDFPIELELSVLILALLVSAIIGVIAGLKPAIDASKLPPIEALRDE
ncbi:ABC transporter permease [Pleionea sediminis]|uniref:ABC transporter permease n=1 Tax=Pleionea sediminis TaxID=2569479 RepID=UPI001185140B|nr:ABC transporter permease [Pleionea sediminis]